MRNLKWLLIAALFVGFTTVRAADEIAIIVKTVNSSFWQNVNTGVEDVNKELGGKFKLSFSGPDAETKIEDQVNMVENAINRRVKAIVLAPSDPDALVPALRRAKQMKIPVVIIDSALNDDSLYASFLSTNNKAAGELCAKNLIERVGKDKAGDIAVMSYVAGVGSEIGRVGGFKDYIAKNSKLKIVNTSYSNSDAATALNQTTDVLNANPSLLGIFGANEPTAVGMGRAIAAKGMGGKLVAIGFDGDQNLQAFIKDGTLQGIAVQNPYNMGYLGVKTAVDILAGKKVARNVDTGIVFVTKENIDTKEAKNVLY